MSEEYLEPITPEVVEEPQNNTTKTILIIVIVIVVLCICLCLCIFGGLTILGPTVGNVFSEIEYELMLTPMP
jgi:hypothetical protein